jgi:hypothetical protein
MITIDDLRAVPMFEGLAADVLTDLARTAADIHLTAGEFDVRADCCPRPKSSISRRV